MNVRFAQGAVRVRLTRVEFDRLLSGRSVELRVALPREREFRAVVAITPLSDWRLETDPTGFWLTLPRVACEAFAQSLPSREGLVHTFEAGTRTAVEVTVEVDVR